MRLMAARALAAAAIVWSVALVAAAYASARMHDAVLSSGVAAAVYGIGRFVCHQRPERSFHVWSVQLPVCARCTGIYFGAAAAALAGISGMSGVTAATYRISRPGLWLAVAASPAAATLVYEWTLGVTPSNGIRAASGVVLGAVVMAALLTEVRDGR
jgi:uncharacterized membrane protein